MANKYSWGSANNSTEIPEIIPAFLTSIRSLYTKLKLLTVGSHELSSVYFKQFNASLIIKGFSVLISIVYVPLVLGFLDQEKFGIWVTITTIIQWIRIADLGMGGGMRNKLSEAIALGQNNQGHIYVSTTYGIIGGVFITALIVCWVINPLLNWQNILNSTLISEDELRQVTTIAFTFIILGFILQPVILVFKAHGNSAAGDLINLIISAITLLLIWLASLYAEKGNLVILALIVTGVPVLVYTIVSFYIYILKYPHFRPSILRIDIKKTGNLLNLSLQFFVSKITYIIIYSSIPFVITRLYSPNEVTIFNIAFSIFNLPIMFMSIVTEPSHPLVTLAYTKKDYSWIRLMLRKLNRVSLLVAGFTLIMIAISPFIYKFWIGDKASIPFSLSVAIGVYAIINVLQIPFSTFTNGTGKILINTILSPISIGLFIGLSIILSGIMDDVISIAMALAFTCLVGLIALPVWLRKQLSEQ